MQRGGLALNIFPKILTLTLKILWLRKGSAKNRGGQLYKNRLGTSSAKKNYIRNSMRFVGSYGHDMTNPVEIRQEIVHNNFVFGKPR